MKILLFTCAFLITSSWQVYALPWGIKTKGDSGYISENVILEVRVSRELIQALDETIGLAQRGMHLASQTKASNDSLQTILRARLARAVLEDS